MDVSSNTYDYVYMLNNTYNYVFYNDDMAKQWVYERAGLGVKQLTLDLL